MPTWNCSLPYLLHTYLPDRTHDGLYFLDRTFTLERLQILQRQDPLPLGIFHHRHRHHFFHHFTITITTTTTSTCSSSASSFSSSCSSTKGPPDGVSEQREGR